MSEFENKGLLKTLEKPLAIAMWDFSWALSEEFGDIEKALDELVERGYNAVRIDVFPTALSHFMRTGECQYTYTGTGAQTIWGNRNEVTLNIPEMVEKMIRGCIRRKIYIGISTWVRWAKQENSNVDLDGIKKIWDDAICFLEERDLMHHILYIDLMNEYPRNHTFTWVYSEAINQVSKEKNGMEHMASIDELKFNDFEADVWKNLSADLLNYFHAKHPQYDFTLSLVKATYDGNIERYAAAEKMDTLDPHQWFAFHPELAEKYHLGPLNYSEQQMIEMNDGIMSDWNMHKERYIKWMEQTISEIAGLADRLGITAGNTEGWGMVGWEEYESVGWEFIKQAAEICIPICKKHSCYKYITTSNFTHPFFRTLWADIEWHRKVTAKIKE